MSSALTSLALARARRAVQIAESNAVGHAVLATVLGHAGQVDEALEEVADVARCFPANPSEPLVAEIDRADEPRLAELLARAATREAGVISFGTTSWPELEASASSSDARAARAAAHLVRGRSRHRGPPRQVGRDVIWPPAPDRVH